ncbi:hypothetical protein B0H14DRAFT_2989248, partial [Mycena olivaceomarginata]
MRRARRRVRLVVLGAGAGGGACAGCESRQRSARPGIVDRRCGGAQIDAPRVLPAHTARGCGKVRQSARARARRRAVSS